MHTNQPNRKVHLWGKSHRDNCHQRFCCIWREAPGTTTVAGFNVSGGRPIGTTTASRAKNGLSPEQPNGIPEPECKEDEKWSTDENLVNVSPAKLKKLKALITKECKFDSTPRGKTVCLQCGRILYPNVGTGHTCLVQSPKSMTEAEAPA